MITIGVTGGIAAYKVIDVASALKKLGYEIQVVMTKNSTEFAAPLAFATITGKPVITDMTDGDGEVLHIEIAKKSKIILIAPATANIIAKLRAGIADDFLTTMVLATKGTVVLAPAMNSNMYTNPVVQENIAVLKSRGYLVIEPDSGVLACGDVGVGKLPDAVKITAYIKDLNDKPAVDQDLLGKKYLITAGRTVEAIDPMRYLSNYSTGKMGYALAEMAKDRGAEVILVSGPTNLTPPAGVTVVEVISARDMYKAVHENYTDVDVVIKAAAVADFRPKEVQAEKIKKGDDKLVLELVKNPDILKSLGDTKKNQILVGFAAESQNVIENAAEKLKSKNLDIIVANNIKEEGAGFSADTNIATIIERDGTVSFIPKMSKKELANIILDKTKRGR